MSDDRVQELLDGVATPTSSIDEASLTPNVEDTLAGSKQTKDGSESSNNYEKPIVVESDNESDPLEALQKEFDETDTTSRRETLESEFIRSQKDLWDTKLKKLEETIAKQEAELNETRDLLQNALIVKTKEHDLLSQLLTDASDKGDIKESIKESAETLVAQRDVQFGLLQQNMEKELQQVKSKYSVQQKILDKMIVKCEDIQRSCQSNNEVLFTELETQKQEIDHVARTTSPDPTFVESMIQNECSRITVMVRGELNEVRRQFQSKTLNLPSTKGADFWETKFDELSSTVQEYDFDLEQVKEDQETAMSMVVDTMAALKEKVEGVLGEVKRTENLQIASDFGLQKILDLVERKSGQWNTKFSEHSEHIKELKKQIVDVDSDQAETKQACDDLKDILEQSIRLVNDQTETSNELWTTQINELKRLIKDSPNNHKYATADDYSKLKKILGQILVTWNKNFEDLKKTVKSQAVALENIHAAPIAREVIIDERETHPVPEREESKSRVHHIVVPTDNKKVTFSKIDTGKILFKRRPKGELIGKETTDGDKEIDHFDLTEYFANSMEATTE